MQQSGPSVKRISAVVLDRGSRTIRGDSLERLIAAGVDEVVSVLGPAPHYDVEQLAARIDRTRFVLLGRTVSAGEQINIGIHEAMFPLTFVLWSDDDLGRLTERAMERVRAENALCAVPTIRSDRGVTIPSVTAPAFHGPLFRTIPVQPGKHTTRTLLPFDFVGVYDRDRFVSLGGFDPGIVNPYWQRLDFGVRAHLWGERIAVVPELRVDATRPLPVDDTTPDASYARFHLKSLAVRFAGDSGRIPFKAFVSLVFRSGLGPREAVRVFNDGRAWVRQHRYRFVQDAKRLTELWEVDS